MSILCPSQVHSMSIICPNLAIDMSKTCPRTCPERVQDLSIQFVHVHLCVLLRASKLDGTGTFTLPSRYHRRTMSDPYDIPLWYHMSYHFRTICRTIFGTYIVRFSVDASDLNLKQTEIQSCEFDTTASPPPQSMALT